MTTGNASSNVQVMLGEGSSGEPMPAERRFEITSALLKKGYPVAFTAARDEVSVPLPEGGSTIHLFQNGSDGGGVGNGSSTPQAVRQCDIGDADAEAVAALVDGFREDSAGEQKIDWLPWFPVIDFDRCTNCMQCLSFCLFDVYGVDEKKEIQVQNNDKCKTNCPACSRVCPEVAILFPKYRGGPINGEEVKQVDIDREKMKIDVSALLGGDIYSMLRDRHARATSRFSKERDEDKALKERQKCLVKLGAEMDVPAEVLMALPSAAEIERKATEAAQRAEEALAERREAGLDPENKDS